MILNLAIVIVCFVIDANLTGRHLGHNKDVLLLVPFCLKCLHRVDAYEMQAGILRRRNGIFMKAVLSLCLFILMVVDTVLKKCVSSKVLIFVVNKKIKERTMKLTREQRSELISEMASSEVGFKELVRVLLDSFSKQERALFLAEHAGEQANGFRPRRWRGHGWSFQLRIPRTRSNAFQPMILGILSSQESERTQLFTSCIPVDFPVKTLPR